MKVAFRRNGKFLSIPDAFLTADAAGPSETLEVVIIDGAAPTPVPVVPAVVPAFIPPTPPSGGDAIDLTTAVWMAGDSPDTRSWPIIDTIRSVTIDPTQAGADVLLLDFPGRFAWPPVNGPEGGAIQFTMVLGLLIHGTWYLSPVTIGTGTYNPTGPLLDPGQIPKNLTYFVGDPMRGYQPQPGDAVAFYCTTGAMRRSNIQPPTGQGRTQVVVVPFQAGTW